MIVENRRWLALVHRRSSVAPHLNARQVRLEKYRGYLHYPSGDLLEARAHYKAAYAEAESD